MAPLAKQPPPRLPLRRRQRLRRERGGRTARHHLAPPTHAGHPRFRLEGLSDLARQVGVSSAHRRSADGERRRMLAWIPASGSRAGGAAPAGDDVRGERQNPNIALSLSKGECDAPSWPRGSTSSPRGQGRRLPGMAFVNRDGGYPRPLGGVAHCALPRFTRGRRSRGVSTYREPGAAPECTRPSAPWG